MSSSSRGFSISPSSIALLIAGALLIAAMFFRLYLPSPSQKTVIFSSIDHARVVNSLEMPSAEPADTEPADEESPAGDDAEENGESAGAASEDDTDGLPRMAQADESDMAGGNTEGDDAEAAPADDDAAGDAPAESDMDEADDAGAGFDRSELAVYQRRAEASMAARIELADDPTINAFYHGDAANPLDSRDPLKDIVIRSGYVLRDDAPSTSETFPRELITTFESVAVSPTLWNIARTAFFVHEYSDQFDDESVARARRVGFSIAAIPVIALLCIAVPFLTIFRRIPMLFVGAPFLGLIASLVPLILVQPAPETNVAIEPGLFLLVPASQQDPAWLILIVAGFFSLMALIGTMYRKTWWLGLFLLAILAAGAVYGWMVAMPGTDPMLGFGDPAQPNPAEAGDGSSETPDAPQAGDAGSAEDGEGDDLAPYGDPDESEDITGDGDE